MVEFLLILPLLILLTFAIIDMAVLMWFWNQAAKATHYGARIAVIASPVATNVNVFTNPSDTAYVGQNCICATTSDTCPNGPGSLRVISGTNTPLCTPRAAECTSTGCTPPWVADPDAFLDIVGRSPIEGMRPFYPGLQPENVRIIYSSVGLGFVDRPGGSPMAVTVAMRNLCVPLIWLDTFFSNPAGCAGTEGAPVPAFATTLVGEDMRTDAPFNRP